MNRHKDKLVSNQIRTNKTHQPLPTRSQSQNKNPLNPLPLTKNIKKQQNQPSKTINPQLQKQPILVPCLSQIITKIMNINEKQNSFDDIWNSLLEICGNVFKFKFIFPQPVHQVGHQLMKDGRFISKWLKIISTNNCVNSQIVYKHVNQKYLPLINLQKGMVEQLLKQNIIKQENITPAKMVKPAESVKRSILKNSEKKVQFGKDQILYPALEQYKPIISPAQQQKQLTLQTNKYILYFINPKITVKNVYFLEQVEIVGVIKQYEFCTVLLAKLKNTNKETLCAVITKNITFKQLTQQTIESLEKIRKQHQNLEFLQVFGKNISQLWVDSLPSQQL